MPHNRGMDWIRLHKRMAIYLRDGFDCVWCRCVFPLPEHGHGLSLDHLEGEAHTPANLVTCCLPCNSERQDMLLEDWLAVLERRGHDVRDRLREVLARPLDMAEGLRLARKRRPRYTPC